MFAESGLCNAGGFLRAVCSKVVIIKLLLNVMGPESAVDDYIVERGGIVKVVDHLRHGVVNRREYLSAVIISAEGSFAEFLVLFENAYESLIAC